MATIEILASNEIEAANAWLHDIFVAGGVKPSTERIGDYDYMYNNWNYYVINNAAKQVCDELINRGFENIDYALDTLAKEAFIPSLHQPVSPQRFSVVKMVKAICYIAQKLKIYWDDTTRSSYEINLFKGSKLGAAVYRYGLVTSVINAKATKNANRLTKATNTGVKKSTTRVAGQPQNDYKQQGGKSALCRGLIGQPGEKIYIQGMVFRIEGDNANAAKVKATAHVKPLKAKGDAGNNVNKIFIGSANGYDDCTLYFDNLSDADDFLCHCEHIAGANISNLKVVKKNADSNGYFKVDTEHGPALIVAQKLNEAVTQRNITEETRKVAAENPDSYFSAMSEAELAEYGRWLRKN